MGGTHGWQRMACEMAQRPARQATDALGPPTTESSSNSVRRFATGFLDAVPRRLEEIGNGNLNRVFRASAGDRSVVIKQAVPYVWRVGTHMPLTMKRLGIEAQAYAVHSEVAAFALPRLLGYDGAVGLLALQDLREAEDWRTRLVRDIDDTGVAGIVGEYLAHVSAGTGPLTLSTSAAGRLHRQFTDSSMQMFTERMVFTAPYSKDSSNDWPDHLKATAHRISVDDNARSRIAYARWMFRTKTEAIVHGDLHTGSVMVGKSAMPRVIDLEFAFAGPIAFDLGTFLAHLLLARIRRTVVRGDTPAIDSAALDFWEAYRAVLRTLLDAPAEYEIERHLVGQAALFAAAEILRRVGGRFHVDDLTTLPDSSREDADRIAVNTWATLLGAPPLTAFEALWELGINPTKEYA